jgi:serine/threonine-protein kinase
MGAVYSAFDTKLERDVALKVVLEEGESNAQRKRLLREARIAAKLQHPNIATVYEVDELEGQLIIVMELLEGTALRKSLHERRFSTDEAIGIARDMARGLAKAHAAGVVHRDIKPENVFLVTLGADAMLAKLLDFGLARVKPQAPPSARDLELGHQEHTNTTNGDMWGTPGYVSPEQALGGKDIDARTDVFSFGVVFYEMLANIRPFRGETAVATMLATTRQEPRALSEIVPDLPPPIGDIVTRCLRKKKEDRFADGTELSAAFEAFARGSVTSGAVRLPSIGSSPSYPNIQHDAPPPSNRQPLASGTGDAPTTGSAAISMTTREETLAAIEHRKDKIKLFVAVAIGVGLAGIALVLAVTMGSVKPRDTVASFDASPAESVTLAVEPPSSSSVADSDLPPEATLELPSNDPDSPATPVKHAKPAGSAKPKLIDGKPADCAKSKFTTDSKGVRIPKLYCF